MAPDLCPDMHRCWNYPRYAKIESVLNLALNLVLRRALCGAKMPDILSAVSFRSVASRYGPDKRDFAIFPDKVLLLMRLGWAVDVCTDAACDYELRR